MRQSPRFPGFRAASLLAAIVAFTGCGGGGGDSSGGGGGSGSGFRISLDRSSFTSEFAPFTTPPTTVINVTSRGSYTGTLYILAVVNGNAIDPIIPIVITGTNATISVTPRLGLAPGRHTGTITFSACSDPGCTQTIGGSPFPVSYTINVLGFTASAASTRTITSESTVADLAGAIVVNGVAPSTGTTSWQATPDVPWLTLTRSSGAMGTNLEYAIVPSQFAALANGYEYTANIALTLPNSGAPPGVLQVVLRKSIGQVTGTGPHVLLTGRAQRLIVRGVGFSAISNLAQRVTFGGVQPTALSRVNDTTLIADLPPLDAGSHSINVSNALAVAIPGHAFFALEPASFTYSAVANTAPAQVMVYDAERSIVYSVTDNALLRWRYQGGAWLPGSLSVPNARNLGLSVDGRKIFVSTLSSLEIVAAESWTIVSSVPASIPEPVGSVPLMTTNDGRVWFANGGYFSHLANYDPAGERITVSTLTGDGGGPWGVVSGDGERMVLTPQTCCSPRGNLYGMQSTEGVFREIPGSSEKYFYWIDSSLDGRRLALQDFVQDENLAPVGLMKPLENAYLSLAGAVSRDGDRCYALGYPLYAEGSVGDGNEINPARVYVFDCSASVGEANLPALGYFDLDRYPGCWSSSSQSTTCPPYQHPVMRVSPDGRTLFLLGNRNFIVAPIPAVLTPY